VTGVSIVTGAVVGPNNGAKTATADCGLGKVALGGGYIQSNSQSTVTSSYPSSSTVWTVTAASAGGGAELSSSLTAYVICGTVPA
jgi:hypothetical protein